MECTCDTGNCKLHDAKAYDENLGEIQLSGSGRKHMDCGGLIDAMDDGIRLFCKKCGKTETWEGAARRLFKAYLRECNSTRQLRQVEENIRMFVGRLGMGHLLR